MASPLDIAAALARAGVAELPPAARAYAIERMRRPGGMRRHNLGDLRDLRFGAATPQQGKADHTRLEQQLHALEEQLKKLPNQPSNKTHRAQLSRQIRALKAQLQRLGHPTHPQPHAQQPHPQRHPQQPHPQRHPQQPYPQQPYPQQPYPEQPYPQQPYPEQPYAQDGGFPQQDMGQPVPWSQPQPQMPADGDGGDGGDGDGAGDGGDGGDGDGGDAGDLGGLDVAGLDLGGLDGRALFPDVLTAARALVAVSYRAAPRDWGNVGEAELRRLNRYPIHRLHEQPRVAGQAPLGWSLDAAGSVLWGPITGRPSVEAEQTQRALTADWESFERLGVGSSILPGLAGDLRAWRSERDAWRKAEIDASAVGARLLGEVARARHVRDELRASKVIDPALGAFGAAAATLPAAPVGQAMSEAGDQGRGQQSSPLLEWIRSPSAGRAPLVVGLLIAAGLVLAAMSRGPVIVIPGAR
jgi:hypothetical protein